MIIIARNEADYQPQLRMNFRLITEPNQCIFTGHFSAASAEQLLSSRTLSDGDVKYPFTLLPGDLKKWGDFSEKFTECLQISTSQRPNENISHLTTEKIPFGTMISRNFLPENEMFSVMPKSK